MLINGLPGNTINANDRGLQYGDGVFRTLILRQGKPALWERHYQKLQHDCDALAIRCPSMAVLAEDIAQLAATQTEGVIKIVITRGSSGRGYAPPARVHETRIVSLSALPEYPASFAQQGIKLQICKLRLSHQPRLAGIKHLNRLENVLAAAELVDSTITEGMLLDQHDCVIEGTRSNLFMLRDGKLFTPELSQCGVAGLQRDRVLEYAASHGIACNISKISLNDLVQADEIFVVNSVIGLWPVREMPGYSCDSFPLSLKIQAWLNNEVN